MVSFLFYLQRCNMLLTHFLGGSSSFFLWKFWFIAKNCSWCRVNAKYSTMQACRRCPQFSGIESEMLIFGAWWSRNVSFLSLKPGVKGKHIFWFPSFVTTAEFHCILYDMYISTKSVNILILLNIRRHWNLSPLVWSGGRSCYLESLCSVMEPRPFSGVKPGKPEVRWWLRK